MNNMQRKPLVICLALFAVLMACRIKSTYRPTSTVIIKATSAPSLLAVAKQISSSDDMVMVYVPAGVFRMGITDEEIDAIFNNCKDDMAMPCMREYFENESPAHNVYLDDFWIDQTEVTNGHYQMCVADGVCTPPIYSESYSHDSYFEDSAFDKFPVIMVGWEQANAYCGWAGRRLPTEAEWEKAARGTDGRKYPWGNESPDAGLLNYSYDMGDTAEVGSYPADTSPYGVMDMAGNVSEWVADWYEDGYYDDSPNENPPGPADGEYRVVRGGDFGSHTDIVRITKRAGDRPNMPSLRYYLGFRCAASATAIQQPVDALPLETAAQAAPTDQLSGAVMPGFQDMTEKLPAGTGVNGVWVLPDGTPWVYGDTGIYSFDTNGQVQLVFDQPVWEVQGVDQSGRVWVLGEGYEFIAAYDGQDWQVYASDQGWDGLTELPYLSPGIGIGLANDSQGRIWIATGADLLRLYEPDINAWSSLTSLQLGFPPYQNSDYQGYFLTDTLISETGEVWLSACIGEGEVLRSFGIWHSAGDRWLEWDTTSQDCVLDMAAGLDGEIWAGGFDALLKYDSQSDSWSRIALPTFDRRQIVSRIIINPATGLPWIQVIRYGGASLYGSLAYYHLDPSGWILDMESPSFSEIGTAFEPDGTAWLCGDGKVMKSTGNVLEEVAILNQTSCQISIDSVGRVWAAAPEQADLWMLDGRLN